MRDVDARELLQVGHDAYTAARDGEVKRRRAEGDKQGAAALKALTRPTVALWGVLAAGGDDELVARVMDTTAALAAVQGAAVEGRGGDIGDATVARRRALDQATDAAVAALAAEPSIGARAEGQRHEMRALLDRLSRHPELADAWRDATLRAVPDDTGFEAFAGFTPAPVVKRQPAAPAAEPTPSAPAGPAEPAEPAEPPDDVLAERRRAKARAEADAEVARARAAVERAERDVSRARAAEDKARAALDAATAALAAAAAQRVEHEAALAAASAALATAEEAVPPR